MKHLKTLLSSACCLSVCIASFSSFGATGADAAAGITSDPGTRAEYESQANMEMATYNKDTKSYEVAVYPVGEKVEWDDILNLVQEVNINLTAAASNSLKALAKVAYLEAMSKFTDARFEKLTETVKDAFESLDNIDIEDLSSKITARLTKSDKTDGGAHYTGYNIFNVAGAQVDDVSIKSNNNDKIEIANFSLYKSIKGVQPYNKGDNAGLSWDNPWLRNDGKTIEIDTDENHRPTNDDGKHGIHIKGWYDQSPCQEKLSQMLTDPNDGENRNAHKLLCRVNTGEDAVLHYLSIGDIIAPSLSCDDTSISTNAEGSSVGQMHVVGAHKSDNKDKFLKTDGEGNVSWEVPPGSVVCDDTSVTTNGASASAGKLQVVGFDSADNGSILARGTDGKAHWVSNGDSTRTLVGMKYGSNPYKVTPVHGLEINSSNQLALKGLQSANQGSIPKKGSDGGLEWSAPQSIDVVTGISISEESGKLKLTISKSRLNVVSSTDLADSTAELQFEAVTLVDSSRYANGTFEEQRSEVYVLKKGDTSTAEIFSTTTDSHH